MTNKAIDAGMVIESVRRSTKMMKLKELKAFPSGMDGLYRKTLQALQSDDRDLLLVALRWLVCGEGQIDASLIADEWLEIYTGGSHSDERDDDGDGEDGEDDGDDCETPNLQPNSPGAGGIIAEARRRPIERLKQVGGDFLTFEPDSDIIRIGHHSVRDFIRDDEKLQPRQTTLCIKCKERQVSVYEAGTRHGNLLMIEKIIETLNSPSFQKYHIIMNDEKAREEQGLAKQGAADQVIIDTEEQTSDTEQAAVGYDDLESALRYELTGWPRHLRLTEQAWPEEEREKERWEKLYNAIDIFMNPSSPAFQCWMKRMLPWRQLKTFDDPFHVAARYGLVGLMRRYLDRGKDINILNENGDTPLHMVCSGKGKFLGLELLVERHADINLRDTNEYSPIVTAISNKAPAKIIQYMLKHGAKPELPPRHGGTCLHFAAVSGDVEVMRMLLAQPTVDVGARDEDGETPLHWASSFPGCPQELIKLLLENRANVNEQDNNSQAPLFEACMRGNVESARLLLEHNADVDDVETIYGNTALHAAVGSGNLKLVELLVENKADMSFKNKQQRDAVAEAACEGKHEILSFLLDTWKAKGIDMQHLSPDIEGCTILHSAARRGRASVVKLLLLRGFDPMARTHENKTPLDVAFDGLKTGAVTEGEEFEEMIKLFADHAHAAIDKVDPFQFAIERGIVEICQGLVDLTNDEDAHGWTPLMLAIQQQQHAIINYLSPYDKKGLLDKFSTPGEVVLGHRPTRWSCTDKHPSLAISEDGLEASSEGGKMALPPTLP
jgi:ankyrin repeat protein